MAPATPQCPACSMTFNPPLLGATRCPRCGASLVPSKSQPCPPPAANAIAPVGRWVQPSRVHTPVPAAIPLGPPANSILPAQSLPVSVPPRSSLAVSAARPLSAGRPIPPRVWVGVGIGVAALLFLGMLGLTILAAGWFWKGRAVANREQVAARSTLPAVASRPDRAGVAPEAKPLSAVIALDKVTPQRAWLKQTLVDAYEKAGQKDGRWDEPVRRVLRLRAEAWEHPLRNWEEEHEAYEAGRKAGCEDPLFVYAAGRIAGDGFRHDLVADLMEKSAHHPAQRCFAALGAARWLAAQPPTAERRRQIERHVAVARQLLPEIAKDVKVPPGILVELCEQLERYYRPTVKDRKAAFDKVLEVFAPAGDCSGLLTFRGEFYVLYAWDARGDGYANTVTPEGGRLMAQRLAQAEKYLEKAWQLDPDNAGAATAMISVEMGQGQGRERMELWFRRAMQADPDYLHACECKLLYLEPKWHGSAPDMLAFGRECAQTRNWRGRLPLILVDAHERLAKYQTGKEDDYFPRSGVWADIQSVLEPFSKQYPRMKWWRSRYAHFACRCGQWEAANRQFVLLGKDALPNAFGGPERYEQLRQEAARRAAKR